MELVAKRKTKRFLGYADINRYLQLRKVSIIIQIVNILSLIEYSTSYAARA